MDENKWFYLGKDLWSCIFRKCQLVYLQWTIPRVCTAFHAVSHSDTVWKQWYKMVPKEEQDVAGHYWPALSLRSRLRNLCFGWELKIDQTERMRNVFKIITNPTYEMWARRIAYHHYTQHVPVPAPNFDLGDQMTILDQEEIHLQYDQVYRHRIFMWYGATPLRYSTNFNLYAYHTDAIRGRYITNNCCSTFRTGSQWDWKIGHLIRCVYLRVVMSADMEWLNWPNVYIESVQNVDWDNDINARALAMKRMGLTCGEPQHKKIKI